MRRIQTLLERFYPLRVSCELPFDWASIQLRFGLDPASVIDPIAFSLLDDILKKWIS